MIFLSVNSSVLLFVLIITVGIIYSQKNVKIRVGIIGAGIGGTSAAYFTRQAFGRDINIDIYEKDVRVGGRLANIKLGEREYEAGGSVIHKKNYYMNQFRDILSLSMRDISDPPSLALYDGKDFIFEGCNWNLCTLAKLFLRYGWDMVRLKGYVADLLEKFDRIYESQKQNYSYSSVEGLLSSMDPSLLNMTRFTIRDVLTENGFSSKFISEIMMGAMRNNYGQDVQVNGFVGSVSLAGVEPGLWSVKGGNYLIPKGLVEKSQSNLIHGLVKSVSYEAKQNTFTLGYTLDGEDEVSKEYDIIIVAVPLIDGVSDIKFTGFTHGNPVNFPGSYWTTISSFIRGKLNATYFHHSNNGDDFFDFIMTTDGELFFNSLESKKPVDFSSSDTLTRERVWKVFSRKPLTPAQKDMLFSEILEFKSFDWLAYPTYNPPENLAGFQLAPNLYYINSIELAASAMEMVAIGSKNVALLAYNTWHQHNHYIDPNQSDTHPERGEL